MSEEINFEKAMEFADNEKLLLKRRDNNLLLSDYQVDILNKHGIDYTSCTNYKDLLFIIENYLNDDYDDELDFVGSQLSEIIYYCYTNK